jgi:hypothetical protein
VCELFVLQRFEHVETGGRTELVQLPDLTVFQLWAPLTARFSFLRSPFVADGTERREQGVPASR